ALQNRIRSILVGQGLPAPVGHRAWTELGLAGIAAHARPLADCGPKELWRGRLHLTLGEREHVERLLDQAEKKLDELARAEAGAGGGGGRPPGGPPARGGAPRRRGGRRLPAGARAFPDEQASVSLRRLCAAAVSVNRHRPPRPHHQARSEDATEAAGGVRLG